jgi:UDP-N-acetylglucosamine acyltransferase
MQIESLGVHPGAEVHPTAVLGDGVIVERDAVVGPGCVIGDGTRIRKRAIVEQGVTMGAGNDVHPYAVIGGDPQDLKFDFDADPGSLIIGDGNIFREGVTISRGAGEGGPTRIGSNCYFMTVSHVGHNSHVGDRVILGNSSSLAGHSQVGDACNFSAFCAVHQFVRVGRLVMFQAGAKVTMHTPPFVITAGFNGVAALNRVGLRRAGMSRESIASVKQAYQRFYRRRAAGEATFSESLAGADEIAWTPERREFVDFIRWALEQPAPRNRGVCRPGRGEGEMA